MEDKKNIERLFSQVKTIVNCYEKMNLENGNNFNIFTALKIESNEVVTHSRFIGELLNPNGLHGLGKIFLDLFLKQLNLKNNFTSEACEIVLEEFQGEVDLENETGGRLDILIKDKTNGDVIMIENKIYAKEQDKQLMRYYNAYTKAELFYLTLFGEPSKQYPKNCINNDTETPCKFKYKCISYQNHIVNWLESCQKHTHNRPFLRETLSQYINLVKKLTNQNINAEMNKALTQLFSESEENFDVFQTVLNLKNSLTSFPVKSKMISILTELKVELENDDLGELKFDENLDNIYKEDSVLCSFENEALKEKNLNIEFKFTKKNTDGLIGGFVYLDMNAKKEMVDFSILKTKFEKAFENEDFKDTIRIKEDNLPCFDYWHFMNLNRNPDDLKNLFFGDFKTNIKQKIEKMIEITSEPNNKS